jgi:hypothetical protein
MEKYPYDENLFIFQHDRFNRQSHIDIKYIQREIIKIQENLYLLFDCHYFLQHEFYHFNSARKTIIE